MDTRHIPHPSTTEAQLPDENTFTVPEAWLPHIHPWRGGPGAPVSGIDSGAVDAVRRQVKERLRRMETAAGLPELLEAAQAQLRGEASPLGAAVVTALVTVDLPSGEWERLWTFADAWVAEHGLVFAAAATAELAGLFVEVEAGEAEEGKACVVRYRCDDDRRWDGWVAGDRIAERIRALLAAADERTYQEAIDALAHRRRDQFQRAVTGYLVPTQAQWVDEVCAAASPARQDGYPATVLGSLSSMEQLSLFRAQDERWWHLCALDTLYTAMAGIGPGIAPVVAELLDGAVRDRGISKDIYAALASLPTDEAFALVLARLDRPFAHAAVIEAMGRYPVRALRLLAAAASDAAPEISAYAGALLRRHVTANAELTAAMSPRLSAAARAGIELVTQAPQATPEGRAARGTGWIDDAPVEALPRLLAEPPWTRPRPKAKAVVIKDLVAPAEPALVWAAGEHQEWAETQASYRGWDDGTDWQQAVADFRNGKLRIFEQPGLFLDGPEDLVRPLLSAWKPEPLWEGRWMKPLVARFGADALPAVLALVTCDSVALAPFLLPFTGVEVAMQMADWLVTRKKVRPVVHTWFRRHADSAARALVPAALGKAGKARSRAEAGLRLIASQGDPESVRNAARGHGDKAAAGMDAFLARDPLDAVPAHIPDDFHLLDVHLLPRILLRDRRQALPAAVARHLITMLAISKPGEPYAGIEVVKELCDPESLAAFGWELFQQETSYASRVTADDWTLTALGRLGDDETVRRLTPLIRSWPGDGGHTTSVAGLDVLATIGTDVALTHLNGIAQKSKYQGIKKKAGEKMTELAHELGLTAEELADRLVPDLDLGEAGSTTLDYGRRRFTVGFDEHLKPYVADEAGKRLKTLPKPGVRDDQDLAPTAHKRFATLKKDLRAVADEQIRRLERAMITQRRWSTTEFRDLIVGHPLLWHIARRLVWVSDDGRSFRLAEDRTLADAHDDTLTLDDPARVGIAHPLHLTGTLDTWTEVFADYEILQPFDQLRRPTHTLTDDERTSRELRRFADTTVPVGKLLGMERRGWERGTAEDNGIQSWISRLLPGNRTVVIGLDPGIVVGHPEYWPEQRIDRVRLHDGTEPGRRREPRELPFGELDPVIASEVLVDLVELTG
ncbi:DUF4132 domain-containing protein [Streptomyces sp. NPDC101227]|uniref:DUF4132 domain-containing protein n=1 Tax=Streptomyces sp. NPDC101227 TaxID=3366136 RepID=UPI003829E60E